MSTIPRYEGPAHPLSSPIEALTAVSTAAFNHRAAGIRSCENAFHLASTILGGRNIIEEFVAARIWPISYGWAPIEIVNFNVNWAAQEVPFPKFVIQLRDGQSANDFMLEIERRVNLMIGEYTMNEYKAYKALVKHKRRINRVFSEVCGDKSFHSRRPGRKLKIPAVVVASCSAAPPRALRKRSSKSSLTIADETTSSGVVTSRTKSLESSKRKRRSSEQVSDVELQAASSLAQMRHKKAKKAIKKIASSEVRRVPSAFDDDFLMEFAQKGFSSWPFLQFYFSARHTPSSENEFVDIGSFSDVAEEVQKEVVSTAAVEAPTATVDTAVPQSAQPQEEASPEFMRDLDLTVHKVDEPFQDVALLETREVLPEGQDPSLSVAAFNKSFGTSHRGELLSVGYEVAKNKGGEPRVLTLWKSCALIDETGERGLEQSLHSLGEVVRGSGKEPHSSLKKTSASLGKSSSSSGKKVTIENLSKQGSSLFAISWASQLYDSLLMTLLMEFFQSLKIFFVHTRLPDL
jgi:hypothetical protein